MLRILMVVSFLLTGCVSALLPMTPKCSDVYSDFINGASDVDTGMISPWEVGFFVKRDRDNVLAFTKDDVFPESEYEKSGYHNKCTDNIEGQEVTFRYQVVTLPLGE